MNIKFLFFTLLTYIIFPLTAYADKIFDQEIEVQFLSIGEDYPVLLTDTQVPNGIIEIPIENLSQIEDRIPNEKIEKTKKTLHLINVSNLKDGFSDTITPFDRNPVNYRICCPSETYCPTIDRDGDITDCKGKAKKQCEQKQHTEYKCRVDIYLENMPQSQ